MKLQTKLAVWLASSLLIGMAVFFLIYGYLEIQGLKARVEGDLTAKGEALVIAAAKGLGTMAESHIRNGVQLPDGRTVKGAELEALLFSDELTLIPESKPLADKRFTKGETARRFDGKEIPMNEYEYKYMSPHDPYTDTYWQQYIDGFMGDKDVVFALPTKYSADPAKVGYIATHNSFYSPTDPEKSKDDWGATGLLSQKYRANRVFNDKAGQAAAANTNLDKPLKTPYERKIAGKTIEMWDMSYPILINGKHWGGFRVSISKENAAAIVSARTWELVYRLGGVLLVSAIGLMAVLMFAVNRVVIRPINALGDTARALSQGDLTVRSRIESADEVGILGQAFNDSIDNMKKLIQEISASSRDVTESSGAMHASAEEVTATTEEIASSVQKLSRGAEIQVDHLEKTAGVIRDLMEDITQITDGAARVNQTSHEALDAAVAGSEAIDRVVRRMEAIQASVNDSSAIIQTLGQRSQEIFGIVEMISSIAQQTNLLALNAAIEAARAGEQGRGFSIVAEEVRKLAEQSAAAAGEISELITAIQQETQKAVESMSKGTQVVQSGIGVVGQAGSSFEQILAFINDVTRQIEEVSASIRKVAASSAKVVASVEEVTRIANANSSDAQNIAAATEEQSASMEEIAAATDSLSNMAKDLTKLVNQFKL